MSSMRVPILWQPGLAELRSAPIRFGRTTKMRLLGASLVIAGSVTSATSAAIALPDPSAAPAPTAKAATPNAAPNPAAPPFAAEMKSFFEELNAGDYLAAIDRAGEDANDPGFGIGNANPFSELWQQMRPLLDENVDPASLPKGSDQPDPNDVASFQGAQAHDAIAEIVSRARRTRIVILNEAHHSPRDRSFGLQVAKALRPLGYSILALEALMNLPAGAEVENARMAADGYPRRKDGTYLIDPAFGDFVRQSLALGYKPVSYEAVPGAGKSGSELKEIAAREQGETDNLMARIFSKDSKSKVLIYVGYEHAAEAPVKASGGEVRWMAARLKAAAGVDPLTIDQTTVSEFSTSPGARRLYALIAPRLHGKATVFFRAGEPVKIGTLGRATDLQVIHPPVKLLDGRPAWLLTVGRHPVRIPRDLLPRNGRRLVQAFIDGEAADAVPVDQVVVEAGKPAPVLMLPSKRVRFAVQDDHSAS